MQLAYEEEWHTYEEWGGVRIWEDDDGCLYAQHGGYSVMVPLEEQRQEWGDPESISWDEAIEIITEWDEFARENAEYWEKAG